MRIAPPWQAPPDAGPEDEARTAAGIHGVIVSTAVMASAHLIFVVFASTDFVTGGQHPVAATAGALDAG